MITTTVRKIIESGAPTASGRTPLQAFSSLGLPAAKAWARMVMIEEVEEQQKLFDKARQAVFLKHEAKGEDGRVLEIDDKHPAFVDIDREIGEVLDVEVSLDAVPVSIVDLGTGPISAEEMRGIRFLLK